MGKSRSGFSWKQFFILAAAAVLGAAAGYLYYRLVGCRAGVCIISGNPVVSSICGAVIGVLLGTIVLPAEKKEEKGHE